MHSSLFESAAPKLLFGLGNGSGLYFGKTWRVGCNVFLHSFSWRPIWRPGCLRSSWFRPEAGFVSPQSGKVNPIHQNLQDLQEVLQERLTTIWCYCNLMVVLLLYSGTTLDALLWYSHYTLIEYLWVSGGTLTVLWLYSHCTLCVPWYNSSNSLYVCGTLVVLWLYFSECNCAGLVHSEITHKSMTAP